MKRFLFTIVVFVGVPVLLLSGIYFLSDPYKILRKFSLEYFSDANRDYLSSELFLRNYPQYQYDSYIFGSSRCCGINTWHWRKYLPEGSSQFLFQAWGESLTGILQKVSYIDRSGYKIKNAIVLIDYPGAFGKAQLPTDMISIKHPTFSGMSRLQFHVIMFWNFLQKPSQWWNAAKSLGSRGEVSIAEFDVVSNDWEKSNREASFGTPPLKDSLKNCGERTRQLFLQEIKGKSDSDLKVSDPVITQEFVSMLLELKTIFNRHNTDFRIAISPAYCYTNPKIAQKDLSLLQDIFGKDKVYNWSGKNELTSDYNNFSDPNHFGLYVGWWMIEQMYNLKSNSEK